MVGSVGTGNEIIFYQDAQIFNYFPRNHRDWLEIYGFPATFHGQKGYDAVISQAWFSMHGVFRRYSMKGAYDETVLHPGSLFTVSAYRSGRIRIAV